MIGNYSAELRQHLDVGENLLWSGKPKAGIVFTNADIFLIPFSLLWCGFAIFWLMTTIGVGAPLFFTLFGIPFVIIGLFIVFGRFLIDQKRRSNTIYGLTEKRVIIKSGVFSKKVRSLSVSNLTDIECNEKIDGFGTVSFGPKNPMMIWGNGMNWWPGIKSNPELELIPNVRKVYNQILELQKEK